MKHVDSNYDECIAVSLDVLPKMLMLSGAAKSMYMYLICTYKSDRLFSIGGELRNIIAETIRVKSASVSRSLLELHDSGLIVKECRGVYKLNSQYVHDGSVSNIV